MVIFYKKWKKYNEIQLTKYKMNLNNRKMTNHPTSPGKRGASIERNKAGTKKKEVLTAYHNLIKI